MLIASATFGLKCHDLQTGELIHNYSPKLPKNIYIKHFAWNKDGTWLAITPTEGSTFILSIKNSNVRELYTIANIQSPTCSIFKHDTKKYLSFGTSSGSVLTYDLKAESVLKKYPKLDSSIIALHYCAKDTHLIAGCANGEVNIFNTISKVISNRFRIPNTKTLSCIKPHQKKCHLLAGGSENGLVAIWDLNQSKLIYCKKFHGAPVRDISFLPDREDILFSMGMDKKIRFQDVRNNVVISEKDFDEVLTCMDVSYDATSLIIGTRNGNIDVYDVRNFKLPKLRINKAHDSWIEKIAVQQNVTPSEADNESSLEELAKSKSAIENIVTLSAIAEESCDLNKPAKLGANDSFLDELGLNQSLNSPMNIAINKRRSSLNKQQSDVSNNSEADSFLDAIGLNSPCNLQRGSLGVITSEVKQLLMENPAILDQTYNVSPVVKVNQVRQSLLLEKVKEMSADAFHSTDKLVVNVMENVPEVVTSTPKLTVGLEEGNINLKNDDDRIRRIVKEEFKQCADLLRSEFKDIVMDLKQVMKEQTALIMEDLKIHMWRSIQFHKQLEGDKLMYRVKESIKIEESFDELALLITGQIPTENLDFKLN